MRIKSGWIGAGGKILFLVVLACLLARSDVSANLAKSGEDCIDCHADVWRDIKGKKYIHKPVGKGDCKFCHVAIPTGKDIGGDAYLKRVKWVAGGINPGREHWFEFEDAKRGATLLLEARSGSRLSVKEFPLAAFDELEELPGNSLVPPVISDVRLLEVTKGIFVSASIAWATDVPADSQVFYGFDKLDRTSMLDRQPVTDHLVLLTGVQPGKTYKFKVVSVSAAGIRSESAINTAVIDVFESKSRGQAGRLDPIVPELKVRAYRRGSKCLVIVSADQPVNVRLGIMPKKYVDDEAGEEAKVIRHLPMNSPAVTQIGICYTCHVEYKKILSHPINVYPKRGMIIPPEYTTLSDGLITCMSCHVTHASNVEFRLVKASKEELCRGCHRDME